MIYVQIEIVGFNSLKKIDLAFTDNLAAELDRILKNNSCIGKNYSGFIFSYCYAPELQDLKKLFTSVQEVWGYLHSISENLRGFTIFIDQVKGGLSKLQQKSVIKRIYRITEHESLCVSSEAIDLFKSMAEFIHTGGIYKMVSPDRVQIKDDEGIASYLSKTEGMDIILDAFQPLLNAQKKGLFFCYGYGIPGLSFLSYIIAKKIEGRTENIPWLILNPEKNDFTYIFSLVHCLNKKFIKELSDYLTITEGRAWEHLSHLLTFRDMPLYEEDAILIFKLYLSAYSRFLKKQNLPVIVFLVEIDNFEDQSLEIIADILQECAWELDIIPFLFSNNSDIPACFRNFPAEKWDYKEWDKNEENTKNIESPVTKYHTFLLEQQNGGRFTGINASLHLINHFDSYTRRILYLSTIFPDMFTPLEMTGLLTNDNSEKIKYSRAFKILVAYGFFYPERYIPVFPDLLDTLKKNHSAEDELFFKASVLFFANKDGNSQLFMNLADSFSKIGDRERELDFRLKAVRDLIQQRKTEQAIRILKESFNLIENLSRDKKKWTFKYNKLFLEAALFDSRLQLAEDFFNTILSSGGYSDGNTERERYIIFAEYFYARYMYQKALDPAKKALLLVQKGDYPYIESDINTLLGKIMLGMQRLEEAKDYLRIARELLDNSGDQKLIVKIYYFESVTYYIYGNISESSRLIKKGIELAEAYGMRRWQILSLFLKGRIYFDLGKYNKASDIFIDCLTLAELYHFRESEESIYIWIARTMVYGGNYREGNRILAYYHDSTEGSFFYAEYLYFNGRYKEALEVITHSIQLEKDTIRILGSPDFVLKGSGFEYIEDLVFVMSDGHSVLLHLLQAFKAFLSVLSNTSSQGIEDLVRLTREEKLSDIDPYNGLYFFLHALCLQKKPGMDDLDRLTLLSKALRHVQTIASRIDVPSERIDYLNRNYWNSRLVSEGRKNKLL